MRVLNTREILISSEKCISYITYHFLHSQHSNHYCWSVGCMQENKEVKKKEKVSLDRKPSVLLHQDGSGLFLKNLRVLLLHIMNSLPVIIYRVSKTWPTASHSIRNEKETELCICSLLKRLNIYFSKFSCHCVSNLSYCENFLTLCKCIYSASFILLCEFFLGMIV